VCLGVVVGSHGVRGGVRIKPFTDAPERVAAYGPVTDESGARSFTLKLIGRVKGGVVAEMSGIGDRDAAQALKGLRLYVPREALPEPAEEEFYHADLVGLPALHTDGSPAGRVAAVLDHGGGAYLEIVEGGGRALFVPFTRRAVPTVDIAGGRVVVDPPAEIEEGDKDDGEAKERG
jgi:16S rRNA processing protein RimM